MNHRHFTLLPTLSFLLCFAHSTTTSTTTHPSDIQALKSLKHAIHPNSIRPGSCLSTWDFSSDPCASLSSPHFTCGLRCSSSSPARVTEISLDSAGYTGSLPHSFSLPFLTILDLSDNSLAGPLPTSLSSLPFLRKLSLSKNLFSLRLPPSLSSLSSLEELYLDNNNLIGSIPASFNSLTNLKRLELQKNRLSGNFPVLSSLTSLYYLDLSDNAIKSFSANSLPASLISLSIRNCSLKDRTPVDDVEKLPYLEVLDLSCNNLIGEIQSKIFVHPSLQQISLSHNGFSSIESVIGGGGGGGKSRLVAVDLSYNNIAGFLPKFMAEMPSLSALSLEYNRFTGMIPPEYAVKAVGGGAGETASFERLLLRGNYLIGPIPGPLLRLKPGSAHVSLVDNCLYMCLDVFFFCQGGDQKSVSVCKSFAHNTSP